MPFPPINLHQRISSPGRELFRRKKAPQPELLKSKPGEEEIKHFSEKLSASWASANFKNLGRKPQQHKTKPSPPPPPTTTTTQGLVAAGQEARRGVRNPWLTVPKPQDSSCDALALSSSMEESSASRRSSRQSSSRGSLGKDPPDIQFTLSLTPEAILVIQKRNLEKQEKQRTANNKQQKTCCAPGAGDFRHRRVFPSSSSAKKTHGGGGAHQQQQRSGIPVASSNKQPSGAAEQPDITAIVKISLLNDQYKYDDVEYEEEDGDVDETVVRKCKEWLKGVESAAALIGKADKLCALPHVKGC